MNIKQKMSGTPENYPGRWIQKRVMDRAQAEQLSQTSDPKLANEINRVLVMNDIGVIELSNGQKINAMKYPLKGGMKNDSRDTSIKLNEDQKQVDLEASGRVISNGSHFELLDCDQDDLKVKKKWVINGDAVINGKTVKASTQGNQQIEQEGDQNWGNSVNLLDCNEEFDRVTSQMGLMNNIVRGSMDQKPHATKAGLEVGIIKETTQDNPQAYQDANQFSRHSSYYHNDASDLEIKKSDNDENSRSDEPSNTYNLKHGDIFINQSLKESCVGSEYNQKSGKIYEKEGADQLPEEASGDDMVNASIQESVKEHLGDNECNMESIEGSVQGLVDWNDQVEASYQLKEVYDKILSNGGDKIYPMDDADQLADEYGGLVSYNHAECKMDPKVFGILPWTVRRGTDNRLYWRTSTDVGVKELEPLLDLSVAHGRTVAIITGCCVNDDGRIERVVQVKKEVGAIYNRYEATVFIVGQNNIRYQAFRYNENAEWVVLAFKNSDKYTGKLCNSVREYTLSDILEESVPATTNSIEPHLVRAVLTCIFLASMACGVLVVVFSLDLIKMIASVSE